MFKQGENVVKKNVFEVFWCLEVDSLQNINYFFCEFSFDPFYNHKLGIAILWIGSIWFYYIIYINYQNLSIANSFLDNTHITLVWW